MSIVDKNIFVLTGAGISRESGIKTFREKDGLWDNYRIEDVCTTEAFQKNPDFVNNFYNERKKLYKNKNIQPNEGHLALAELEQLSKKKFLLVTQNIDDLHRDSIDEIVINKDGNIYRRIADVFDCWFESGSMPYARNGDINNMELKPAEFICEGLDQTRGWFYTLLIIATILDTVPLFFQNLSGSIFTSSVCSSLNFCISAAIDLFCWSSQASSSFALANSCSASISA